MTPEEIASQFIGIPYRHGGRDRNGLDCLGLILAFYREAGIVTGYNDSVRYSESWYRKTPRLYAMELLRYGKPATFPLKALDLVYFAIKGVVRHAGVLINERQFIHIIENHPVMVSRLSRRWARQLVGARRFV